MSKQTDEAASLFRFLSWLESFSGPIDGVSAREGWNACLEAFADKLELARRVEALPPDYELWHNAVSHEWEVLDDHNSRFGEAPTPLDALRHAHIGDEEGEE